MCPLWFDVSVPGEDAKPVISVASGGRSVICRATEGGERNEVDAPIILDRHESIPLNFARFQEPRVCTGQLRVAIAGMRDQFEGAFRHGGDQRIARSRF